MSELYQPPLVPGGFGSSMLSGSGNVIAPSRSPFFSVANQFLPRNLHDVIRWARYITMQSPVTTEVVRKLATYPVTNFTVETDKASLRKQYQDLFKGFQLKSVLHEIGFEYHTIGNVFLSIYFPIHRSLVCSKCATTYSSKTAEFAKFVNFKFEGTCPSCSSKTTFSVKDTKSTDLSEMNLVKWDPTHISVNHNPITNEYEYYYKIPNDIKRRVKQGDKLFVNSMPWSFIEAIEKNQDFKFAKNNIFHLKNLSTGNMVEGISIPPLISQFNLVFYQATLRKANESVAQDYMAPLRVIYPTAQTGNSDPVISLSMGNFVSQMQNALVRHKQDSNHVLIAPVPVGYQAISGEGKSLLVSQEIQQAEESLLLSMGVSRELLSGTTNWTSSTVGLRLLENTLQTYVGQIELLLDWLIARITAYLGWETCPVGLVPFRLTDDDNMRQALLALQSQGKASVSTILESYGTTYEKELDKIKEDTINEEVNKAKMQLEVDRGVFLAAKQMTDKFDQNNDYRTALTKAQQITEQLHTMDLGSQRQVLNDFRVNDFAMYLMVSKLLAEYSQAESAEQQGLDANGQPIQQPGSGGAAGGNQVQSGTSQPSQPNAGSVPGV